MFAYHRKLHFLLLLDFVQEFLPTHEKYAWDNFFLHFIILHWKQHMCKTILLKGVSIFSPIMYDIYVIFPWSSQQNMENVHTYDIT